MSEEKRRNRVCPHCGMGVMPEAEYCIRCGERLPEMERNPRLVEREEERRRRAGRIWLFDLFPGLLSGKVVGVAVLCFTLAIVCGFVAETLMGMISGYMAIFLLPLSVAIGFTGVMALVGGITLLLYGELYNPIYALQELKGRQFLALATLVLLGLAIFGVLRHFLRGG